MAMSGQNSGPSPTQTSNEYTNRIDRRRRGVERLLNAPFIESNNLGSPREHGGYIQFRVSPFGARVIAEVAALFGMASSQYCKAVVYRDVGLVFEPVDRRKKRK
jgi:hypothetical protein